MLRFIGHLYLLEPSKNFIVGIPIFPKTKGGGCPPATPILFSGNLYLCEFEPIINPIVGMPIFPRTKGTTTANFEFIEVPSHD